jgi:hypothetical protein
MPFDVLLQVEYDGNRQRRDPLSSIEDTLIDSRKNRLVTKEQRSLVVDGLQPQTVYTFNISAKFIDASWGPTTSIRVETNPEGCKHVSRGTKSLSTK